MKLCEFTEVRASHKFQFHCQRQIWKSIPFTDEEKTGIFKCSMAYADSIVEIWHTILAGRSLLVYPKDNRLNLDALIGALEYHKVNKLNKDVFN